jgi:hypothetical protein
MVERCFRLGINLALVSLVRGKIQSLYFSDNGVYISVLPANLVKILRFFRDSRLFQFKAVLDLWAVDFLASFVFRAFSG